MVGGSALTFVVKAGTVSVLVSAEAAAGPIERPPLSLRALRRANVTNIEPFLDGCRRLWVRYVKLGACLLLVYAGTAVAYFGPVLGGLAFAWNSGILLGWTLATATVVEHRDRVADAGEPRVPADPDGHRRRGRRRPRRRSSASSRFVRSSLREVAGIFGVVLVLVALATIASILATAGLGLIAFVPLAGFVVFPLTAAGWLLRGFVFQYLALTALGAYLTQYRHYLRGAPPIAAVPGQRPA